jgi:hypothetical protein
LEHLFNRVYIVMKSAFYFFISSCLSVGLHVSAQHPLDWFMWNLILGIFMKICQEIPNLVKIGQKYRAFYMKM